jgi:hypothetical protein
LQYHFNWTQLSIIAGIELPRDFWSRLMFPKMVEQGDLDHGGKDYNDCRPRSSLGNLTPSEFALKSQNNEGTGAMRV